MNDLIVQKGTVATPYGKIHQLVATPRDPCHSEADAWTWGVDDNGYSSAKPCSCMASWKYAARYTKAAIPPRFAAATFDQTDWDRRAVSAVRVEAEACANNIDPYGPGLLLCGPWNGSGKSHIAACIAHHRLAAGQHVRWLKWERLLRDAAATYDDNVDASLSGLIDGYLDADLLVIDELRPSKGKGLGDRLVDELLAARADQGRTMLVTTNMAPDARGGSPDLAKGIGGPAFSRLIGACKPMLMKDTDWRLKAAVGPS